VAASRLPPPTTAELAAAVDAAAESLILTVGRSAEDLHPKISPPQLRALLVLEQRETTNLGELAAELGTIASSASRLCDRLQAAGLIVRRPGRPDRRAICLELTEEAVRLLERLREARRSQLAAIVGQMSTAGAAALLSGLEEFSAVVADREIPVSDAGTGDMVHDGMLNNRRVPDGIMSDGILTDGFVTDGFVTDGFVTDGFVDDGVVIRKEGGLSG
jgi:DNA-binding MarR family transcriptional regulator